MPDDQNDVVSFLGTGATHGRAGDTVLRIETHASIIFLIGDLAFKLKRAVAYPYLDYSTVARREAACRAELELNRRTAPEIYLGVRSITREADGRLAFDGTGAARDWVVAMRRFPEEDLFDRMAETGRLSAPLMRDLADRIAAFHGAAAIRPGQGGSAAIAAVIAENDTCLRLGVPALDAAAVTALTETSQAALTRLAPRLDERQAQGFVRRCHGDLHLGNICLINGTPTLFDAVEFNDAFADIDVAYDLAFLVMDLIHRGLTDFASLVFNRYLDGIGDEDALPLFPLFLSLRAAIRAHVAVAAASRIPDIAAQALKTGEAAAYLTLARQLLDPVRPVLVAVAGRSGTGKSTIAAALAPALGRAPGARILRSDALRKRLFGVAPETALPKSAYDGDTNARVYAALYRIATRALDAGSAVVVDAAALRSDERHAVAGIAMDAGVPFCGLWLEAPIERIRSRVRARRDDASDADLAVIEFQADLDPGPLDWVRIDADGDPAASIAASRRALEGAGFLSGEGLKPAHGA